MDADREPLVSFVKGLELAPIPPLPHTGLPAGPQPQGGAAEAYVSAGSLISFAAEISAARRSDVLNSTLLAQLAADNKYDRQSELDEWYRFYYDVLGKLGWSVQGLQYVPVKATTGDLALDTSVIEILSAMVTPDVLKLIVAAIAGLKGLSDTDRRFVLWQRATHGRNVGVFQVDAAVERNEVVALKTAGIYVKANVSTTRLLWHTFARSAVDLKQASGVATLNVETYATIRQQVIDKLGNRAKLFIAALEI